MASTTISTNDSSTAKLWAEKFFRKIGFETIVSKLMGEGDNAIISVQRKLEKESGDRVRFHIVNELGGEFIPGSGNLEGQEQKLTWNYQDVTLEEYKMGVRIRNGIDIQRSIFPIAQVAEERLKFQVSKNLDKHWFGKMFRADKTFSKTVYGGSATSVATLTAADSLTHQLCSKLKYGALSGWQTANQTVNLEPFKPVRVDGEDHLVLLVHPYAVYDLVQNPAYQIMVRDAMERSKSNPLFSGAVAIMDGVIIKTSNYVPFYTTGGAGGTIPYCTGLLLGAQASCWAWGKQMEVVNKAFGYAEEEGWGAKLIFETERTRYTPNPSGTDQDYATAQVVVACSNLGA